MSQDAEFDELPDLPPPRYVLSSDIAVLDHLADGLYSSVAAVLTEAVANAWDADASIVKIKIDFDKDRIVIWDNGIGMDHRAINDQYLRVGYRRRNAGGDTTPRGRSVMGRKGIGKLSLFAIADKIRVETRMAGNEVEAFIIDQDELRKVLDAGKPSYAPNPDAPKFSDQLDPSGTILILQRLKRPRLGDQQPQSLRRRLARRFSIIGSDDFTVNVNGENVSAQDRDDLKFAQYLWVFDGTDIDDQACQNVKKRFMLPDRAVDWQPRRQIRGWIATVDTPRQLRTSEGNLTAIPALSRTSVIFSPPLVSRNRCPRRDARSTASVAAVTFGYGWAGGGTSG